MFISAKWFGLLFSVAAAFYATACWFLYSRQTRMIFFPQAIIETTPADFQMNYQEVWLPVGAPERSDKLHGWWIPALGEEKGVLLYLHGNGVNIGANVEHAHRFHRLGLSVLLIDYRGYGQSRGAFPSEPQVYEDATAAWQYLTQARQIPAERILIFGHSLGGAIAIQLATQQPNAAGLIVQSSFTSIRQMIDRVPLYRIFPVEQLLTQRFDSIRKVSGLQMPVLFIHGLVDSQVPAEMSRTLYRLSPQPKTIFLVPTAGHNNVALIAGEDYLLTIQQFLQQIRHAPQPQS
ncbi:MAG: alpha/beta hydrolase [Elainella sp. Prado103]|jgi:hypothetical protein|nr:alpha/beta hydrolase [Elainella sp. Prado103]